MPASTFSDKPKLVTETAAAGRRSLFWHAALFVTGLNGLLLGPLLPRFASLWNLGDAASGLLLAAHFAGSYAGAVLLQSRLERSLRLGGLALLAGYVLLLGSVLTHAGFVPGLLGLAMGGFGIGQLINGVLVAAGNLPETERARQLMSLNVAWSCGAFLSPLLVALLPSATPLGVLVAAMPATSAMLVALEVLVSRSSSLSGMPSPLPVSIEGQRPSSRLPLYFALCFFLYGGMENSLHGWIATYVLRYTGGTAALGALTNLFFLGGLTAGRAAGMWALRQWTERAVQRTGLLLTLIGFVCLRQAGSTTQILWLAAVLGTAMAPFLPVTASLFLGRAHPSPRVAGLVMASSALGGVLVPWLVGHISESIGSLRLAFLVPAMAGVLLLILSLADRRPAQTLSGPAI